MTQELHDFANRLLHVNVFFPNDKEQNLINHVHVLLTLAVTTQNCIIQY